MIPTQVPSSPEAPSRRDIRIDLFRGLALVFIFLDHIPNNTFGLITLRNFGFSDAAEMFVFFSGFSAGRAYGAVMERQGWWVAAKRILKRCRDIYLAHLLLLAALSVAVTWAAAATHRQAFLEDMRISPLFWDAPRALFQTLLLRFRPENNDVLPLYVVVMLCFPAVLWALEKRPRLVLLGSFALYGVANWFNLNFHTYPHGDLWLFNPLAWQALFTLGAYLGIRKTPLVPSLAVNRVLVPLCVIYLLVALYLAVSWVQPWLLTSVPAWLGPLIYPISKTNLAPLRFVHFLALAYLGSLLVPIGAGWLRSRWAKPLVRCGQHSLPIFCTGVFLSFVAYYFLVMVDGSLITQGAVSGTGIGVLIGAAFWLGERKIKQAVARAAAHHGQG
jgi:hypothetical protein